MGARGSTMVCLAIAAVIVAVVLQDCDCRDDAPPAAAHDPARGKKLFYEDAMCLTCHMLGERGGQNAPPLDHVATKFTKLKGGREQARAWFRAHLSDPVNNPGTEKAKYPFTQMPSFAQALPGDNLEDLIEFVLTFE